MSGKRRIVVTGMGIVSPVGNDLATAWTNVTAGNSGIGPLTHFDTSAFATKFGGEVRDLDPTLYVPAKDVKKMDPFILYGIAAGRQAWDDSGLNIEQVDPTQVGVAVGAGIGGIGTIEKTYAAYAKSGPRRISPFFVPSTIINMISGHLSILLGLKGPNIATVTACTTATHNIGLAARLIAHGDCDVMIAGGAEHATTPLAVGGFISSRALSPNNDNPTGASRPWDLDRDGFVLSDGAGVMVLEEYEHAKARGARIYAELAGFGLSADAHHMTAPPEDGSGAAQCMTHCLRDAGMTPDQVQYVNAHATSTPLGDRAEVAAIRTCFGEHADKLMVSSTKSVTGHLLGAAGGIEALFSVLALRDQVVPPTMNLDTPDPDCDLDFVPNTARETALDVVMSNSFGFGGTNGCLLFKRSN